VAFEIDLTIVFNLKYFMSATSTPSFQTTQAFAFDDCNGEANQTCYEHTNQCSTACMTAGVHMPELVGRHIINDVNLS